jgi:hypothetical protein
MRALRVVPQDMKVQGRKNIRQPQRTSGVARLCLNQHFNNVTADGIG